MNENRQSRGILDYLLSLDAPLILAVALIFSLGLMLIDSATFQIHQGKMVARQATSMLLGIGTFWAFSAVPIQTQRHYASALWLICVLLVAATYVAGSEALGAKRWLIIMGLRFQPSEFLKATTILMLASLAESYSSREDEGKLWDFAGMVAVTGVSFVLIAKQPDLGSAMTVGAVTGGMFLVMGVPVWALVCLVILGAGPLAFPTALAWFELPVEAASALPWILLATAALAGTAMIARFLSLDLTLWKPSLVYASLVAALLLGPVVWNALNPYQRLRLTGFLAPELDPRGSGYNLIQSLIAVSTGGVKGQGLRQGSQTNLGFLPHKHTDFIFCVLAEELGFFGVVMLLGGFAMLYGRILLIALGAASEFGALVATGVVSLLAFQTYVNLGMSMGLAPITGVPLPFVSFGGTALVGCMALVGMVQAVAREPSATGAAASTRGKTRSRR